jgi:uncharacterized protein (DUF58 family)
MSETLPADVFKKIRQLEIRTRGLVNSVFGGEYHSAFKGKGVEFAEVREYQYGDDVRAIDWNVSARRDDVYVKLFDEEREQTLMILFDASASGVFGTEGQFKKDMAAEICSLLAFSAIKNNDKVGLVVFTDEVELFISPRKGKRHVLRILREIFFFKPKSRKTNLKMALEFTTRILKRKSIVFLVSDFMDTGYEDTLRMINTKHDFIAIQIGDPAELSLPRVGLVEMTDAETGRKFIADTFNDSFRRAYATRMMKLYDYRKSMFNKYQIDSILLMTHQSFIEPLTKFFKMREKRF